MTPEELEILRVKNMLDPDPVGPPCGGVKHERTRFVATIHFSTDGKTDVENLLELAADRMSQVFSVDVTDTHVEEVDDEQTSPNA